MDTPDIPDATLVVVEDATATRPDEDFLFYRRRDRTQKYALAGLAISGWLGFFVLATIVLAARTGHMAEPVAQGGPAADNRPAHLVNAAVKPAAPDASPVQPEAVAAPPPAIEPKPVFGPQPVAILTTYEERRRIQERVLQWDAADYQDGNVAAARQVYEYAASKGWAPAALSLALTYDPHELQRRGVAIAANPGKARACYIKARELMNATVAFYLSRLPQGTGDQC